MTKMEILQFRLPMIRSDSVLAVQRRLIALGHLPPDAADGMFSLRTKRALMAFQTAMRLAATGMLDDRSAALLDPSGPTVTATAATPTRPPRDLIPATALPDARVDRIILHWTGGGPTANRSNDRPSYHFLIEQDGKVVVGDYSVADNNNTRDGRYAMHTWNLNTGSIGVALCGMVGAKESPFRPGPSPIVPLQIEVMAQVVAQLCRRYDIPVTRRTVLAHGEVESILDVKQKQKWDPLVLPWARDMKKDQVGALLRDKISAALAKTGAPADDDDDETPGLVGLTVTGQFLGKVVTRDDAELQVPAEIVTRVAGVTATIEGDSLKITVGPKSATLPLLADGMIDLTDLAEIFGLDLDSDGAGGLVLGPQGSDTAPAGRIAVTVRRGDTLRAIAMQHLHDPERWTDITDSGGRSFDEASARRLRVGQTVLVPKATAAEMPPSWADSQINPMVAAIASAAHRLNQAAARQAAPFILRACRDHGVTRPEHVAYIFATSEHETNLGRTMTENISERAANANYGNRYGNTRPGDGYRYRGRGYVQVTFKDNYRKMETATGLPLVANPDLATIPENAAQILVLGVQRGLFTGKRLAEYDKGPSFDFYKARAIVNGDADKTDPGQTKTRGQLITEKARAYLAALNGVASISPPPPGQT